MGVLVGVVKAREGRKEREVQDNKRWVGISEWKGSGRGVAEVEGAV
jgi:hypothetical protein